MTSSSSSASAASAASSGGSGPAIELIHVTKRFGERAAIDDISLQIARNKTTVLLGPSGTGKSTLLRMATGLLAPDSGTVRTLDVDVFAAQKPELLRLRRRMGMLFQDNALFGGLSVFDNIAFPLRRVQRAKEPEVKRRVDELLSLVGLPDIGARAPDRLSGGQRKRVALARAMALSPELVLFDEPTSGLDPQTSASIDQLIKDTQTKLQLTFVVITHDIESARLIADDAGLLLDGKVHIFGTRAHVWASTDPRVRAFLDREVARAAPP